VALLKNDADASLVDSRVICNGLISQRIVVPETPYSVLRLERKSRMVSLDIPRWVFACERCCISRRHGLIAGRFGFDRQAVRNDDVLLKLQIAGQMDSMPEAWSKASSSAPPKR